MIMTIGKVLRLWWGLLLLDYLGLLLGLVIEGDKS